MKNPNIHPVIAQRWPVLTERQPLAERRRLAGFGRATAPGAGSTLHPCAVEGGASVPSGRWGYLCGVSRRDAGAPASPGSGAGCRLLGLVLIAAALLFGAPASAAGAAKVPAAPVTLEDCRLTGVFG